MSKEGWDLRSNIKAKPGAQGTLFSGGRSQMPDAKRYPRGYNPERQREVLGALGSGIHSRMIDRTIDGKNPTSRTMDNTNWTRETKETLKRSSVPADTLKGVFIQRMRRDDPMAGRSLDGALGVYQNVGGSMGNILIAHDADQPTVLHELGHRDSHMQGTWHARYSTPHERGAEEGYADRFVDEHAPWKPGRTGKDRFQYASRRGLNNYEPNGAQTLNSTTGARRPDQFAAGYDELRPHATRVPNSTDQWRLDDSEAHQKREAALQHQYNEPTLPGMDATSRLYRTGPWEGVNPS